MEELCTACHCTDRKLFYLNETGYEHIYSQIIHEIPMYNLQEMCVRVCWECKALLRKLTHFKEQVKRCYTELMDYVHQNAPKYPNPFANYSNLQASPTHTESYPQEIKIEVEDYPPIDDDVPHNDDVDVKSEETHCEPETFVKNLRVGKVKKKKGLKNLKKEEKPKKEKAEKPKRKVKLKSQKAIKKRPASPEEVVAKSRRISRTVESIIQSTVNDCYNKQEREDDYQTEDDYKSEGDHKSEDEHKSEVEHKSEDVEMEEKIGKKNLLNGVKLPKPVLMKEQLSDKPVCSECGKTFSSRKTYRYHLNVLHKGQNRYPCPRCGKVYQWKSNLGRHMRSHKARDSGELYCETCDKRFASVATYRQHLRISRRHVSESEFSFMCNECGKKFVNKTRLRDHIDWEHLKKIKFKCQLCNKPFKCHTSLYVHLQNVHRSKDKKDNLCHVCGKSYQNAAKLKYHIVAMHTSETPYQCTQCAAAFGWYSSLYRHVREVHYKMKVQPKKSKKSKKCDMLPPLLPTVSQQIVLPPHIHQSGPGPA